MILSFAVVALFAASGLSSCTQESFGSQAQDMESFYNESRRLDQVTGDSIKRFATKVETYIKQNPEQRNNPYFIEIVENIQDAAKQSGISIVLTIDPEWEGEIEYHF